MQSLLRCTLQPPSIRHATTTASPIVKRTFTSLPRVRWTKTRPLRSSSWQQNVSVWNGRHLALMSGFALLNVYSIYALYDFKPQSDIVESYLSASKTERRAGNLEKAAQLMFLALEAQSAKFTSISGIVPDIELESIPVAYSADTWTLTSFLLSYASHLELLHRHRLPLPDGHIPENYLILAIVLGQALSPDLLPPSDRIPWLARLCVLCDKVSDALYSLEQFDVAGLYASAAGNYAGRIYADTRFLLVYHTHWSLPDFAYCEFTEWFHRLRTEGTTNWKMARLARLVPEGVKKEQEADMYFASWSRDFDVARLLHVYGFGQEMEQRRTETWGAEANKEERLYIAGLYAGASDAVVHSPTYHLDSHQHLRALEYSCRVFLSTEQWTDKSAEAFFHVGFACLPVLRAVASTNSVLDEAFYAESGRVWAMLVSALGVLAETDQRYAPQRDVLQEVSVQKSGRYYTFSQDDVDCVERVLLALANRPHAVPEAWCHEHTLVT